MNATTVAIDLAKNVFELAVADVQGRVTERCRLTGAQLERWFANREVGLVVMEACGSAHHWGRWLKARGVAVKLLPARYVKAYLRRNKTDAADCLALLEAARAADIVPVRVKSLEQQALQGLHRIRSGWMAARTARINTLRGLCREFGLAVPPGARTGLESIARALADEHSPIPTLVRGTMKLLLEEIRLLEARIGQLERELAALASQTETCQRLLTIPGVGLLTATAMVAAVGDIGGFRSARHFACWLGLTPREFSSGDTRRMGRISKRGDTYLRMLLVHGARALLRSAVVAGRVGRPLDRLRQWALQLQQRTCHNKAAVALANKLARIVWATWRRGEDFQRREPLSLAAS
jgi:transposase